MTRRRRVRVAHPVNGTIPLARLRERPSPRMAWLRYVALALVVVGCVVGGGIAALHVLIDPAALKADAEAALRRATGREFRIAGNVSVLSYLGASVAVDDVMLRNRPGGSAPEMLRIARLEAELSLTGLLARRIEIERLVVVQPELLVEFREDGSSNWQRDPAEAAQSGPLEQIPLRNINLKDGRLTVRDRRTNAVNSVVLRRASFSESNASGQLVVSADLLVGNQRVGVTGQVDSLARLIAPTGNTQAGNTPWSVRLTAETPGARLSVAGGFTRPLEFAGYSLRVDAAVADTAALSAFSRIRLPSMRAVVATARIADTGGAWPDIAGMRVQVGASDLGTLVSGLKLDSVDVHMPGLEQSLRGEILGTLQGVPVRLQFALGGIAAWLPDMPNRPDVFPIEVTAEAGGSELVVKGRISEPATRRGLEVAVSARVQDLELLSPLVQPLVGAIGGRSFDERLPALRSLIFAGKFADAAGGFSEGLTLRDFTLTAPQGDIAGDLVMQYGTQPSLRGTLRGVNLDADALHEVLRVAIGQVHLVAPGSAFRPRVFGDTRTISDAPFRVELIEQRDVDVAVRFDTVRALGMAYRDVVGRLVIAGDRLALGPVSAQTTAGRADLQLTIEARDPRMAVPTMSAALRARLPGMPLQPLLAAFSRRDNVFGDIEVDADLRAHGNSLRALAASVTGHLGLAVIEGDIDSRLLLDPLAGVLSAARVPLNLATLGGTLSRVRCMAVRLDAVAGTTAVNAFALESGRILIEGSGGFDLAEEAWALRLRPAIRLAGPLIVVPLLVNGPFSNPRMELASPGTPPVTAAAPAAGPGGARRPVPPEFPDVCIPALQLARGGRAGPLPSGVDARQTIVVPQ